MSGTHLGVPPIPSLIRGAQGRSPLHALISGSDGTFGFAQPEKVFESTVCV
jgi:hypothetical protein